MEIKEKVMKKINDKETQELWEELYQAYQKEGKQGIENKLKEKIKKIEDEFDEIKKKIEQQMEE